mmetsp:Transcript_62316/g.100793  ORF Transcript_62316/g.100793 Transcript_62316/m.100793 type:complete len:85 (-) Transcript_62316:331-585(-)
MRDTAAIAMTPRFKREVDAAIAMTPRIVDASKHSGRVLRNPLALSVRDIANAHHKHAKHGARLAKESPTPGYITDRRFRVSRNM